MERFLVFLMTDLSEVELFVLLPFCLDIVTQRCTTVNEMLVAGVTDSASDDCVVLDVKMPREDLVKKAVSLQLPPTFFNYLDLPECPGCIGCNDSFELQNVKESATSSGVYHYDATFSNCSCSVLVAVILYRTYDCLFLLKIIKIAKSHLLRVFCN